MALAMQTKVSEVLGVDVHPAARLGGGLLIDHATVGVATHSRVSSVEPRFDRKVTYVKIWCLGRQPSHWPTHTAFSLLMGRHDLQPITLLDPVPSVTPTACTFIYLLFAANHTRRTGRVPPTLRRGHRHRRDVCRRPRLHHPAGRHARRVGRVVTPGGCQIEISCMEHTGCHDLNRVLPASKYHCENLPGGCRIEIAYMEHPAENLPNPTRRGRTRGTDTRRSGATC
jgi:hypothetical protein